MILKPEIYFHFKKLVKFICKSVVFLIILTIYLITVLLVPWRLVSHCKHAKEVAIGVKAHYKSKFIPLCMNTGRENVIKMLKRIKKNIIDMILDIILFLFSLFYVLTVVLCVWRA